jgi:hypothetical protein
MEEKTEITAADLFVLLDREFRRRRRRECEGCFVSLPFPVDSQDGGASDWEMVMPGRCAQGCEEVLEELLAQFQGRYALKRDAQRPAP